MKRIRLKVGEVLANEMIKNNMSQRALATKIGIRQNTAIDLIKNRNTRIDLKTLEKIVSSLNIENISEIIDIVDVFESKDELTQT